MTGVPGEGQVIGMEEPVRGDRSRVPTQAEMLRDHDWKYDTLALENTDMAEIMLLYTESEDETQALQMLTTELKKNLQDKDGKRSPNFEALVTLGLLDERCTRSIGDDPTAPKNPIGGCKLLTRKGAAFLGINLGEFNTCEQIVGLQEDCAKKVRDLIDARDRGINFSELYAKIIQDEPLLQSTFPPHEDISNLLRDMLRQLSMFKKAGAGVQISANYRGIENASKMGWIPSEWWEKKEMGDWSLVYGKLAEYIDEFDSIFGT